MKLSHFFIERPIFAAVVAILITLIGGFAFLTLAIAQYPEIAPPTIVVSTSYPGASAQVVSDTVAASSAPFTVSSDALGSFSVAVIG